MTSNRAMVYAGELAVAVGAGVKDGSIGSFLMVIGICAIIEGIVTYVTPPKDDM